MGKSHNGILLNFRVSPREKEMIEANIKVSGMTKQHYLVRSCVYQRLCVVGKKENIMLLVDELNRMYERLEILAAEAASENPDMDTDDIKELKHEYHSLLQSVMHFLSGAQYLWKNQKVPDAANTKDT